MKTTHVLFVLMIILMPVATLRASDNEGWTMTNFNNENGLPQSGVKFTEMDNDGYLWMATESGIVRYDGKHFRVFDNKNSLLARNRYIRLGKTGDGRIYCVDDYNHIAYYNPASGFSKPAGIRRQVATPAGTLIDISPMDMGVWKTLIAKYTEQNIDNIAYYATGRNNGFLTRGSNTLIACVLADKVQWADTIANLHEHVYRRVASIGDRLCYISQGRELVLINAKGLRTRMKMPVAINWDEVQKNERFISLFNQDERLYLNAAGAIYELTLRGDQLLCTLIVRTGNIPFIQCVRYYPEQGLLVVGSNTKGLFLFKKQQLSSIGKGNTQSGSFYAMVPYGHGQLLTSHGLVPGNNPIPNILGDGSRLSILRDHDGNYWFPYRNYLFQTDDQFRVLKKVQLLQDGPVACIQEDEQHEIWVSQAPSYFGRVSGHTMLPVKLNGTEEKTVISFIAAGDQTFWLVGKGLCMWLDVKNNRQRIYHEFDDMEVRTAYLDKQNHLWLGTYGQGYFLLLNGRFIKMPEDEQGCMKIVHCFLEDRKGFIWTTTNKGLFQYSVNDLYRYAEGKATEVYYYYYGLESGLKASEFNGGCTPSGMALSNGQFVFPSLEGIVTFHPDIIKPVLPVGKLFIEQLLLDGVHAGKQDLLNISPSFGRLELTVSSPYYGNPANLHIQYNVEGLDDRWYPLGEDNRIVLNRLKYGNYRLRIKKISGFGTGNYVTAEVPLFITPFFYQTWWFRTLSLVFIVLLILLFIRVRYRYLIRQRDRLEAEVKGRTSALVYNNRLMEKLTVMIAHDLKSPLHFLSKVTGHLQDNVQRQNMQGIDRASSEIKDTADQVYEFIEEFNLWVSSFTEGFAIKKTAFTLNDLFNELGVFFSAMLLAKDNKLFIVTASKYVLNTDRDLLKIILRNIIDNANKHGNACNITISVHATSAKDIAITIADTGAGMNGHALSRIHDRIAQASTAASIEKNSRLGYQIIIDFATRLSAKLEVLSEPGKGTAVTIIMQGKVQEATHEISSDRQVVSMS